MLDLLRESRALPALLVSGLLFMVGTVILFSLLLLQPPTAESGAIAPAFTPTNTPVPPSEPEPTPTPSPTQTISPTITPSPVTAAGDRLTLPTTTPTPSPSPTSTATPTPIPPTPDLQSVEGLRVGNIAPDFTLGSNRASRVSLSELRGKIVILNFWASWCPPCRHEVPALQTIHHEFGPQGVVVLAVNEREKLSDVERFAHDNGINFTVWLDEDGWAGNIYQVRSIPTTYFIDTEGIIRAIQIGSMSREQIVAHLEKLL